ncbi:MAG TPA: response regulator, partial [Rhodopila sp.]
LVADDVEMNREIVQSFLSDANHEVTCVEDGAEAVAAAAAADYDVILMDVRMPRVDGLEATRRIRRLVGPRGQVPIVGVTAQAFAEQVADCRKAGMDAHLSKPFSPDALLAAVAHAAEVRPA